MYIHQDYKWSQLNHGFIKLSQYSFRKDCGISAIEPSVYATRALVACQWDPCLIPSVCLRAWGRLNIEFSFIQSGVSQHISYTEWGPAEYQTDHYITNGWFERILDVWKRWRDKETNWKDTTLTDIRTAWWWHSVSADTCRRWRIYCVHIPVHERLVW